MANVGLVDTHSKGIRGHHHAHSPFNPAFLPFVAVGSEESAVVIEGGNALAYKRGSQFLRLFPVARIDDGRTLRRPQMLQERSHLVLHALLSQPLHFVSKVLPHEAHPECLPVSSE